MDIVNALVALAERLSQGGVVLILLVMIALQAYAIATMFRYIQQINEKVIAALIATERTIAANTQVGERAVAQSEQNRTESRIAIEGLTSALADRVERGRR